MADDIQKADPEKGQAVQSVTTVVPHEADSTSAPNVLPDSVNRPPVSTNQADVPIAHSLIAGAGAPQPPEGDDLPLPEDQVPDGKGGVIAREDEGKKADKK